ncbi:MAG: hypothetical protein ACK55I_50790, partial [bacterium]
MPSSAATGAASRRPRARWSTSTPRWISPWRRRSSRRKRRYTHELLDADRRTRGGDGRRALRHRRDRGQPRRERGTGARAGACRAGRGCRCRQ